MQAEIIDNISGARMQKENKEYNGIAQQMPQE